MKTKPDSPFSLADVAAARVRLAHGVRRTPCTLSPALSEIAGIEVWLKRDDLQRTGSFKERGARNALLCLSPEERARGVVAASAGNHALGLAYHAAQLGVAVTVIMPATAPEVKIIRCRGLGARVVLHGQSFEAAHAHALAHVRESGAALIHPFDDLHVIAGQGTMALEILEQAPALDAVIVPVGGGGLLAGAATVVKALRPDVRIVAVEPEGAASFLAAARSGARVDLATVATLADGLAVSRVGMHPFAIAAPLVDDAVIVTEREIGAAMALLARKCGAVVEGAAAAALAAVLARKVRGRRVVVAVGGRNIDARTHAEILARHPERPVPTQIPHAA